MKIPELLCPVGGPDTLSAALKGGADAVYFGGKEFNARMNAKNFDRDGLKDAIGRCHAVGVRAYVTLNTLLTDRQLNEVPSFVCELYEAGCDALITADLGLALLLRKHLPEMELHASTQMTCHGTEGAIRLRKMGFSRVVCAREMDRDALMQICRESGVEIEIFVHGALCASHSGQCLMSSMIGGRSGNRGECAQPCRLPYDGSYPLSLKDLSLAEHVPEILSLGVSSLKIEGRMKGPDYVYTAARIWRSLLDEKRSATPREMSMLSGAFSRSGFTDAYFTGKLSPKMLGIRTEKDKKKNSCIPMEKAPVARRPALGTEPRTATPWTPERAEKTLVPHRRSARFYSPESVCGQDYFHEIYLPPDKFDPALANGVFLPAVIFDRERDGIRRALETAREKGADHLMLSNFGHLALAEGLGFHLHGDFRLNLTNSTALGGIAPLEDAIVSPELNLAQLRDLRGQKRVIVYGRLPLMVLERPTGRRFLRDRRGVLFPLLQEGKREIVLNSVPIYMADRQKELKQYALNDRHFLFTVESREEVAKLIEAWRNKIPPQQDVRRIK